MFLKVSVKELQCVCDGLDQNKSDCISNIFNSTVGVTCLPSALVVLGCSGFGNVNGLLECSSQVNGALLNHLPDVLDPVLLVLDA